MCSSEAIVQVTNGEIDGPKFIVSYSNGYSSFIAAKNDGAKDGAMGFRILSNNVLTSISLNKKQP
jgi:hypothetical protein